jgi:hypothetical protein
MKSNYTKLLVALVLALAPTALSSTTWYVNGVRSSGGCFEARPCPRNSLKLPLPNQAVIPRRAPFGREEQAKRIRTPGFQVCTQMFRRNRETANYPCSTV